MEASQASRSSTKVDESEPPTPDRDDNRPEDFLQSGRTGRRNALANILGEHASVTSSDLPSQLEALTTKDKCGSSQNNGTSSRKS